MQKEMWFSILSHQLKGIMFHVDAYGIAVLHGYSRMRMCHAKQVKEETDTFMHTRCKSIECLGEIADIPAVQRIAIPPTATEKEIAAMWLKWEMEASELYAKASATDSECDLWHSLHNDVAKEIRYISRHYV